MDKNSSLRGARQMICWAFLPMFSFLLLLWLEKRRPLNDNQPPFSKEDWILNLSGFFMQGAVIPAIGYYFATVIFPSVLPELKGILQLGFVGAFTLNIVGVDFIYYLQHRAFHSIPWLYKLHAPHHNSSTLNIWVTSRNAIFTHFLFVYMLLNPILGFLCDSPEGFFAGSMVTASLDLFRHANWQVKIPILSRFLTMPQHHHRHHDAMRAPANFGANWLIWDKILGTSDLSNELPQTYAPHKPPPFRTQLLSPWS